MDIIVKGRHTDVRERFKKHATNKLAKIERLDQKVIRVDVEVSKEHNPKQSDRRERVELTIRSRGPTMRAEASADDRYAALDMAMSRLEARMRKMRDRRKVHRGMHTPVSVATATAPLANDSGPVEGGASDAGASGAEATQEAASSPESTATSAGASREEPAQRGELEEQPVVPIQTQGEEPLVVREKFHRAHPMTIEQALFEMELVGHDFYLFRDHNNGQPSVVYRRHGYDYGVIRLIDR